MLVMRVRKKIHACTYKMYTVGHKLRDEIKVWIVQGKRVIPAEKTPRTQTIPRVGEITFTKENIPLLSQLIKITHYWIYFKKTKLQVHFKDLRQQNLPQYNFSNIILKCSCFSKSILSLNTYFIYLTRLHLASHPVYGKYPALRTSVEQSLSTAGQLLTTVPPK